MRKILAIAACCALGLCLLAASGCGPAVESPAAAPAQGTAPVQGAAPAYHQPGAWWRAQHSALLGGAGSLWPWSRPAHQLGECLVCHRPERSCQPCHAYVGVPALGEDR